MINFTYRDDLKTIPLLDSPHRFCGNCNATELWQNGPLKRLPVLNRYDNHLNYRNDGYITIISFDDVKTTICNICAYSRKAVSCSTCDGRYSINKMPFYDINFVDNIRKLCPHCAVNKIDLQCLVDNDDCEPALESLIDDEILQKCNDCNKIDYIDDMYSRCGNLVCNECSENYSSCDHCGDEDYQDNLIYTLDTMLCRYDHRQLVSSCDSCGDEYWITDGPDCSCNDYYDDDDYDNGRLHSYHSRSGYSVSKKGLHIGLEIEMRHASSDWQTACEKLQNFDPSELNFYLEEDSSLDNEGFEVVTRPFLTTDKKECDGYYKMLEEALKIASDNGMQGCIPDTGNHVSLSMSAFTTLHLFKFMSFFYCKNNRKWLEMISQRTNREFGSWCSLSEKEPIKRAKYKNSGKMQAVNLSHPRVEVRLFRSSTRYDRIRKNIDFCLALFYYTRDASIKQADSLDSFLNWLSSRTTEYSYLYAFLCEKMADEMKQAING